MSQYTEKRGYENLEKGRFECIGAFDIPHLSPTSRKTDIFIPFNEAKSRQKKDAGIHFFIDDYQFQRLWTNIGQYVQLFSSFKQIMTPDFSLYTDFPTPLQIYNHYRKHWIGAYLQALGIDVIPTISWSDEKSFEWCFDGEPTGGCVAVSSVGCMKSRDLKTAFLKGYNEMLCRLTPTEVIFYGSVPEECTGNIYKLEPFYTKFGGGKNGRKR